MNEKINVHKEIKSKLNIVDVINEYLPLDNQLKAKCPFHNDTKPSFSVNREGQYFKCFGCGATGDIFDFVEKFSKISKGEALKRLANKTGVQLDNNKPEVVATYEYKEESGNFLYAIDKIKINSKKKFLGWRLENGKKVYNLNGVKRVLYRLPELIKGNDPVIIVEGEKDVETARSLGFTATTNPHGAGKWQDEYSRYLKDRNCVLIPDNDEPGRKHIDMVSDSLIKHAAKSIKIMNLPGLEEREDLTDYINNGGTKEALLKLIDETPEIEMQKEKKIIKENPFSPQIIEGQYRSIHPALDYINDTCIVTIPMLTKIPEIKEIQGKVKIVDHKKQMINWCITSEKEVFQLNDEELANRGFYLMDAPSIFDVRWNYLDSIKPWLNGKVEVSPKELFYKIENEYKTYLDFIDNKLYGFFTLWSIGTYFHPLFTGYPIIFLNGDSGSGKSKTIIVTEGISFNAVNTGNITDSSIFRMIESSRCTMLLDENEKIANHEEYSEQVNLLLAGFFRGAKVYRTETKGKSFVPKKFEVFSPKMVANIRGMRDEALKNRTIMIKMFPGQDNRQNNYPNLEESKWQSLRNDLYIFAMDNCKEIKDTIPEIKGKDWNLSGYFFMMWQPMFALAKYFSKYIGKDILEEIAPLAEQKIKERKEDKRNTYNYLIIKNIKQIVDERNVEIDGKYKFISTSEIREAFLKEIGLDPDSQEAEKNFDPRRFGHWIANLGIGESHKIRDKFAVNKTIRGWKVKQEYLDEICKRYDISNDNGNNGNNGNDDTNDYNGNNDTLLSINELEKKE